MVSPCDKRYGTLIVYTFRVEGCCYSLPSWRYLTTTLNHPTRLCRHSIPFTDNSSTLGASLEALYTV